MSRSDSTVKGIYERPGEMESSLVNIRAQVLFMDLKITLIRFFLHHSRTKTNSPQAAATLNYPTSTHNGRNAKEKREDKGEEMTKHLKCHRVAAVGKGGKGRKGH